MTEITLCCFVHPDSIFNVEIEDNESVSNLKKLIEKENPIVYVDKLWKVDIPLGEDGKPTDIKEFESEELDTTKKVIDYFPDNLSEKRVHIIVQREQINVILF